METIIEKLSIKNEMAEQLKKFTISKAVYDPYNQNLSLKLKGPESLPFTTYLGLKQALIRYLKTDVDVALEAKRCHLDFMNLEQYVAYCARKSNLDAIQQVSLFINGDIRLLCLNEEHEKRVIKQIPTLEKALKECGITLPISAMTQKHEVNEKDLQIDVPARPAPKMSPQEKPAKAYPYQRQNGGNRNFSRRKRYPKKDYDFVPLELLKSEKEKVTTQGEVFMMDVRELRSGSYLVKYGLHNGTDALMALEFLDDLSFAMKKGSSVQIYGDLKFDDRYDKDYVFQLHQHEEIEPLFHREDTSKEKRIEFHVHTNRSEMDGVSDISEYLDQAYAWGHPGLVLTDHAVVQAFPKAHRHFKMLREKHPEHDFKLVYGSEMNLVDSDLMIVRNPDERPLHQGDYVVFDLETTGLSAHFDHIIEFGAVRIKNGRTVDKMQIFVKPPVKISQFIQDLTSIRESDVANAKPIDEAIDDILSFIGDDALVAHNAGFDIDFLQENLKRLGRPLLKNPVIDTLDLARAMFSDRRSYRLGSVARLLNITYDESVAHRADYDAEVLSLVFLEMLRQPILAEKVTVKDLMDLSDDKAFAKVRNKHVNVLAKNQKGLKRLYELISLSHTEYLAFFGKTSKGGEEFMAEPRILREVLEEDRENLLIGAGCTQSEIFEYAANKGDDALEDVMRFYDYIEIMPLDIYRPQLAFGSVPSEERLHKILQRIIKTAEKLSIPIIASGNVHYNHPNQKVIRDVYIHSQGIGGTRHPLFIFNQQKRLEFEAPNQHFRTTQEMFEEMAYVGDEKKVYEYVIANPRKIFEQIDQVSPLQSRLFTPSLDNSDEKLKELVYGNAKKLYGDPLPNLVQKRLDREMKSIIGHGYGVIYYISHLLVKKSLRDGYLVGSRGSVGSSFAATMAEITEVNPLEPHYVCPKCHYHEFFLEGEVSSGYDLEAKDCPKCGHALIAEGQDIPFETFLGFEGDKVPDIDLNFSGEYQEFAHAYTKELFGEEYVYRAGTISTVAAKTAYGYVLGYHESIQKEASNKAWNEYLAQGAEGVKRTSGQHPGGIIVIPNDMDVHDFTPIQYPANNPDSSWYTTHYEFHDIEDNVLKLDILGHVDPTAMKMLEKITGIDVRKIPMNDPATISLFSSPKSLGVDERKYHEKTGGLGLPEFGTPFVRRMLEATRPNKFSDLVRISGLSHGTDVWANNAEELIKNGYTLDEVIGCRDDIMVGLMQYGLEPKMAFDIMESVRKGRGLRDEWVKAMKENGVPDWYIDSCLKIKYMFPKAHAAAYVMMAVRIAWFKVYHPRAYYAVYFTLRVDAYEIETMVAGPQVIAHRLNSIQDRLNNFETKRDVTQKEKNLIDTLEVSLEMYYRGYRINPISLEHSDATEFILDPHDDQAILPPFNVVDGLGNSVAKNIVKARDEEMFISKEDMMRRGGVSSTLMKKLDDLKVTNHLQESNQMSLFDSL